MYFTSGSSRAFESLMQGKPGSTTTTAAAPECMRIAALAASTARIGNTSFAFTRNVHIRRAD